MIVYYEFNVSCRAKDNFKQDFSKNVPAFFQMRSLVDANIKVFRSSFIFGFSSDGLKNRWKHIFSFNGAWAEHNILCSMVVTHVKENDKIFFRKVDSLSIHFCNAVEDFIYFSRL